MESHDVQHIAVSFVKKNRNVDEVNVMVTEQKEGVWVVRGTCPIDLGGHPWRESFEVTIDAKGKIRESSFRLM